MTLDDIIAAFRNTQKTIFVRMESDAPMYSPESAKEMTDFIETFIGYVKAGEAYAIKKLSRFGEQHPDAWCEILDMAFADLDLDVSDDEFYSILEKELN